MQGLTVPITISSLVALLVVAIVRTLLKVKGYDAMEDKVKGFINMGLGILYTMSANIAGGALLAKALQLK